MRVSVESIALVAICLVDLASTIFLVNYRQASEGNPLMAFFLTHYGLAAFVGAKIILCVMPLFIIEYARRHRPRFARIGLRVAIAAYLVAYLGGVAQLNSTPGRHDTRTSTANMVSFLSHTRQ